MYLSLPIGSGDKTRTLSVDVCRMSGFGATNHAVKVLKFGSIADLKEALSKECAIPADRLVVGELYCHDIWRFFKAADEVSTISKNDHIAAWEVDPQDVAAYETYSKSYPSTGGDPDRLRMIVITKRPAKKAYSEWETFGLPVLLSVDTAAVPTVKALYKVAEERFGHDCEHFELAWRGKDRYNEEEVLDALDSSELPVFDLVGQKLTMRCSDEPSTPTPMDSEKEAGSTKAITLDDCIAAFLSDEKLSEQETWYCPKCKEHRQAIKKFDFWRMPEILVVHLKRFDFTKYTRDKREDLVSFPIEGLDLGVHLNVPGAPGAQGTLYDLYAVSNHFGGLGGGHYTAYAKNPVNKQWYNFNDSFVDRVEEDQIQTAAAYVLFYQRRAT